jgi:AraC-like DNA-binding protein
MQLTCYVLFGYFFLKKKQQQLEQNSNVLANSMSWLKNFFLFNIIFVPIIFALSILTGKDEYFMPLELITLIMQCFYIFAKSVWKSGIFAVEPKSLDKGDNITIRPKTQLLLIDEDLADKYIIDLEQVIRKKKLYLHSEFTIQDLANASSISLHHISNILNIRLQKSFPDFFNEFRIEHAKELLLDPESRKYTMEQIAKDCGFGSKSNFNICFKKHTKLTPTEYRKKVVSPES